MKSQITKNSEFIPKALSNRDRIELEHIWITYWEENARTPAAERWYQAVMQLLYQRGDEVISRAKTEEDSNEDAGF